ncbi:MAG TPA: hypothetical protein PLF31_00015 [Candidatus Paceibacterota bacterium]|nr:hypothetical protein [Candidatus Paceibacterota bacterium]
MNPEVSSKTGKFHLVTAILLFLLYFGLSLNVIQPKISEIDFHNIDEYLHSAISANILRDPFPPQVRINALDSDDTRWTENQYWQHIPPFYTYIPVPVFLLDGEPNADARRITYAALLGIGGMLFIFIVWFYERNRFSTYAAGIAACIWIITPFTRDLITGHAFNHSDVLLALLIICSFGAILWYQKDIHQERKLYSLWKISLIAFVVTLPVVAKSALGAIPLATFVLLLIRDHMRINTRVICGFSTAFVLLLLSYGMLFLSHPDTFIREIWTPFLHFDNYEGWSRPWHYFVTGYLPEQYLPHVWTLYFAGLVTGIVFFVRFGDSFARRRKLLLSFSILWFMWNLGAISLVEAKSPNFIYQTYLLSLFFVILCGGMFIRYIFRTIQFETRTVTASAARVLLGILVVVNCVLFISFFHRVLEARKEVPAHVSSGVQYDSLAKKLRGDGVGLRDIFLLSYSYDDCYMKYHIIFKTGAETKTLQETNLVQLKHALSVGQYDQVHIVFRTGRPIPPEYEQFNSYTDASFKIITFPKETFSDDISRWMDRMRPDISSAEQCMTLPDTIHP